MWLGAWSTNPGLQNVCVVNDLRLEKRIHIFVIVIIYSFNVQQTFHRSVPKYLNYASHIMFSHKLHPAYGLNNSNPIWKTLKISPFRTQQTKALIDLIDWFVCSASCSQCCLYLWIVHSWLITPLFFLTISGMIFFQLSFFGLNFRYWTINFL